MVLSMDRWVGKVAVVTGAGSSIGSAITAALVGHGLKVAGLTQRKDLLEALSAKLSNQKGKLYPIEADLSIEKDIAKAFEWIKAFLGPVHILVNNAGIFTVNNLVDGDTEKWKKVFDVNVLGLSIATRAAIMDMKANKVDGHVIHISSVAGLQVPDLPRMSVYPASKFAVRALAETLRLELINSKSKIKITNVSPGVDTEIISDVLKDRLLQVSSDIMKPEDIADAVVYTLSTPPHVQVQELTIRTIR